MIKFGKAKMPLIFTGGFIIGAAISAVTTFFVVKEACEKKKRDEIAELREAYQEKISDILHPKAEESEEDGGNELLPTEAAKTLEGHVDTSKVDYTKRYNKESKLDEKTKARIDAAKKRAEEREKKPVKDYPTEDDINDEPIVEEITEMDDDLNGIFGYGRMPGYDTVEMVYYTYDDSLDISSWNDFDSVGIERTDEQIQDDENQLSNDIHPYLHEIEFDSRPYDVCFIRDHRMAIDARIVKKPGSRNDYV